MTDPTVDALALAAIIRKVDGNHDLGAGALAAALADAGYVVVPEAELERLDDALAAIRSYVGDHDIHPAHMPDCLTCVALNGRVAPRRAAAIATAAASEVEPETSAEHESWCYRRHTGDCVDGPSPTLFPPLPPVRDEKVERLRVALERIVALDYRGHPSLAQTIARVALEPKP